MLTKCANPSCSAAFQRLRSGRLFQFELHGAAKRGAAMEDKRAEATLIYRSGEQEGTRVIECFWLCDRCAEAMSLRPTPERTGVLLVRLAPRHQQANAS